MKEIHNIKWLIKIVQYIKDNAKKEIKDQEKAKEIYEKMNQYHMIHSYKYEFDNKNISVILVITKEYSFILEFEFGKKYYIAYKNEE